MKLGGGGGKRDRTADLLHAMQAFPQLSYTPDRARNYSRFTRLGHALAARSSLSSTTFFLSAAAIASMAGVCARPVSATRNGIITAGIFTLRSATVSLSFALTLGAVHGSTDASLGISAAIPSLPASFRGSRAIAPSGCEG